MASYLAIVIIVIGIASSIAFGTYMYYQYQPNFILSQAGSPIQVGPVIYVVDYLGTHKGDSDITPDNIFFQIEIIAENVSSESTLLSGGQFYLLDENDKKYRAVYGDFEESDLYNDELKPNIPIAKTTQFDIPFDENMKYRIGILPTKQQSSNDIGIVCIKNC